jgi:hypothetical protein
MIFKVSDTDYNVFENVPEANTYYVVQLFVYNKNGVYFAEGGIYTSLDDAKAAIDRYYAP